MVKLPHYVILNTRDEVELINKKLSGLLVINVDISRIITLILDSISDDTDEPFEELEFTCMDILSKCVGRIHEMDVEVVLNHAIRLGISIYLELKKMGMYIKQQLPYKFHELLCSDIVLVRKY